MVDDKGRKPTGSMPIVHGGTPRPQFGSSSSTTLPRMDGSRGQRLSSTSSSFPRVEVPREARIPLAAQVRLQYASILDFHESQSVNISRSGMFVAADSPASVGTLVDFEFCLDDGLCLLKGKGEVVRVTYNPTPGMGLRFRELDEESRRCIGRIVDINEQEGRAPQVPLDFTDSRPVAPRQTGSFPSAEWNEERSGPVSTRSAHPLHGATRVQPGLSVVGQELQIRLTPLTAGYFTNNPLINIRLGGFVIPIEDEVSLGAIFNVNILDNDGMSLFSGKGKVVAKHERRIGIRLGEVAKPALARLQAEVARLSPGGR